MTLIASGFRFLKFRSQISEQSSDLEYLSCHLFVGYVPNQIRRRRNKERLNKNEQEPMLFGAPKSHFHYLCL